jgi:nickel transport protein
MTLLRMAPRPGFGCGLAGLIAGLLIAWPAWAHDLWLERHADGLLLQYGHRHSGHEGNEIEAYPADMVLAVDCFAADGTPGSVAHSAGTPVIFSGPCEALHVLTSSGFWTRTTQGLRNQPASELTGVLRSWESVEGVKRLEAWSPALAQPLTRSLELTPKTDPFSLRPGDKLRLLVSFEGAPRAGVTVAYEGEPRGISDSSGHVNIRIRHAGFQAIGASFELPRDDGLADVTVHATALNFEIPGD